MVANRRTKRDFACAMRYLVDTMCPDAARIDVVLDNLNTHVEDARNVFKEQYPL